MTLCRRVDVLPVYVLLSIHLPSISRLLQNGGVNASTVGHPWHITAAPPLPPGFILLQDSLLLNISPDLDTGRKLMTS